MGQIIERLQPRKTFGSQENFIFPEEENRERAFVWIRETASKLREIWWELADPHPLYDVGIFLLDDPRPYARSVEFELIRLGEWIEFYRSHGESPQGIEEERAAFLEFVGAYSLGEDQRILEIHLPPRPTGPERDFKEALFELDASFARLAGWTAAHNGYCRLGDRAEIGIVSSYQFSLVGERAVRRLGRLPFVTRSGIPKSLFDRHDLIFRLIADSEAPLEKLASKPLLIATTTPTILQERSGIKTRVDEQKGRVELVIAGRVISLPHAGNDWTMEIGFDKAPDKETQFPEMGAQALRGVIQVAMARSHEERRDTRVVLSDKETLQPYIPREEHRELDLRNLRPWGNVFHFLGREVVSYGVPPGEILRAYLQPPPVDQR